MRHLCRRSRRRTRWDCQARDSRGCFESATGNLWPSVIIHEECRTGSESRCRLWWNCFLTSPTGPMETNVEDSWPDYHGWVWIGLTWPVRDPTLSWRARNDDVEHWCLQRARSDWVSTDVFLRVNYLELLRSTVWLHRSLFPIEWHSHLSPWPIEPNGHGHRHSPSFVHRLEFHLMIDDDLHVQCFLFDDSFNGSQIDPEIISIENPIDSRVTDWIYERGSLPEFADALKFINVVFRHLSNFK